MKKALALVLALVPGPAFAQTAVGAIASQTASGVLVARQQDASLYDVNVVSGATAGYVLVLDARAEPADGPVTPRFCLPLAANTGIDINFRAAPMRFVTGVTVVFSSGASCFVKATSATAFISASAQ